MIPQELEKTLIKRVASAVTPREAAVDVMKAIQNYYGWLTDEGLSEASNILGLTPLQLEELATFYEMIYRRPVGRAVIHVCDSISCWSSGSESLMAHLKSALGINEGETTPDGMFTLLPCSCLGNCGNAPTLMIGERIFNKVSPAEALQIMEQERQNPELLH